jgi:4-hydroxybenzoate polyprenyltransferase
MDSAFRLGVGLLVAGWAGALLAGWRADGFRAGPAVIATALVTAVLLYDRWLKRTWAGPLGMGACRFLNVLLGLSVVGGDVVPWGVRLHVAAVIGLYVVGVTWFARTEARTSDPAALQGAVIVVAVALILGLILPLHWPEGSASPLFVYLLGAFALAVGLPAWRAVESPTPSLVQRAVKRAVLGLVALDAVLATAAAGAAGLLLLLLLPPAMYLGRWVYST